MKGQVASAGPEPERPREDLAALNAKVEELRVEYLEAYGSWQEVGRQYCKAATAKASRDTIHECDQCGQPLSAAAKDRMFGLVEQEIDQLQKKSDELRPEYDFSKLGGGVRGKYVERYRRGTNLVRLDRDVAEAFPTDSAVNRTLRAAVHPSASGTMRPLTRRIPPGPSSRSSRARWNCAAKAAPHTKRLRTAVGSEESKREAT